MEIITTKINTMSKKEVICIELDRFYKECLTIGKKYEVLHELKSEYRIIDDNNSEFYYPKYYFKPVKNKSKKAKKIKMVTCTSKNHVDSECLTIDKKYLVMGESEICYKIIDDNSNEFYYQKTFFKHANNKSKKAKKIKALRLLFNVGTNATQWCINIVGQKGNVPEPLTKMHSLHVIALEEVNKEKPSMRRIKFLISEMESLTQQTIKD